MDLNKSKFLLLLVAVISFSLTACKSSYDKGYEAGYEVGYERGYQNGHLDGYEEGEEDGYISGYATGTGDLIQENGSVAIGQGILMALVLFSASILFYILYNIYKSRAKSQLDKWINYLNSKWAYHCAVKELQNLKKSSNDYSRFKASTLVAEAYTKVVKSIADEESRSRVESLRQTAILEVNGIQSEMLENTTSSISALINEVKNSNNLSHYERAELYGFIQQTIKNHYADLET